MHKNYGGGSLNRLNIDFRKLFRIRLILLLISLNTSYCAVTTHSFLHIIPRIINSDFQAWNISIPYTYINCSKQFIELAFLKQYGLLPENILFFYYKEKFYRILKEYFKLGMFSEIYESISIHTAYLQSLLYLLNYFSLSRFVLYHKRLV